MKKKKQKTEKRVRKQFTHKDNKMCQNEEEYIEKRKEKSFNSHAY